MAATDNLELVRLLCERLSAAINTAEGDRLRTQTRVDRTLEMMDERLRALERISAAIENVVPTVNDIEKRVRKAEISIVKIMTFGTAGGIIGGVAVEAVFRLLHS